MKVKVKVTPSCPTLGDFIDWTVVHQAPLFMGFSRQECWSGLPRPPPGDFSDPGIEPKSLTSPALGGVFFTISATWGAPKYLYINLYQSWVFFGRNEAKAETPVLWPPHAKS